MSDHTKGRLSADLAPPYAVRTIKKPDGHLHVQIESADHVVAEIPMSPSLARRVAGFIVRACNARGRER